MLPQAAADHYRTQRRLAAVASLAVARIWAQMGNDFDASWADLRPRLLAVAVAAQIAAARLADPYLTAVLAETEQPDAPVAALRARGFAGTASDGRPLPSFLYGAVTTAKTARSELPTVEALARGGRWLGTATETLVADTSRSAVTAGITVRPDIDGYVRATGGSACSRCLTLAGRFYRYDAGFARHPRCHCLQTPSTRRRAGEFTEDTDVHAADLSSLDIAARTLEGRRMPEQIVTNTPDRTQAISLLRRAGFVI